MGFENISGVLDDLIEKAGGCAVIDGGFATQLELHGASINDPLWSALCLIKDPHLIKRVHTEYLEAGADILVTSSYQATLPGFVSRGLSLKEAELLLENSVKLAVEARDKFWDSVKYTTGHRYNRALVAASIGSYGAYLADGSEYSGNYGPNITLENLKDFHRRRLQVLVAAGPDLLAFETIPNKLEAQLCSLKLSTQQEHLPDLEKLVGIVKKATSILKSVKFYPNLRLSIPICRPVQSCLKKKMLKSHLGSVLAL